MRTCKKCGALLEDNEKKCPLCGARNKIEKEKDSDYFVRDSGTPIKEEKKITISDASSVPPSKTREQEIKRGNFLVSLVFIFFFFILITVTALIVFSEIKRNIKNTPASFPFEEYIVGEDISSGEYVIEAKKDNYSCLVLIDDKNGEHVPGKCLTEGSSLLLKTVM